MVNFFRVFLILFGVLVPLQGFADSGKPFFDFMASSTDDKTFNISSLRGKPIVVNFWARWCGPCRKEIPDFVAMDVKYRSKGIVILGLAVEEPQYQVVVREFAKTYNVDYPILLTGTNKGVDLMTALGNDKSALPFTVIFDRTGNVTKKKLGAMTKAEMETAIETALRQADLPAQN